MARNFRRAVRPTGEFACRHRPALPRSSLPLPHRHSPETPAMWLMDVFNFIKEMIELGAGFIAAFSIGAVVLFGGLWWLGVLKWPWRGRDKKDNESHSAETTELKGRVQELEKNLHSSQDMVAYVQGELHETRTRLKEAEEAARDCANDADERASQAEERARVAQKKMVAAARRFDSEREKALALSAECER